MQKDVKENQPKYVRQSNIELLRIIAMIMIVAHHFSVHGGFSFSTITVNSLWIQFMQNGGKIGVDVFVLISGYFLISPYVNKLLYSLSKKEYQKFLVLLTIIWCILPTFIGVAWQCNDLLWFVYLYAFAGYIKLYMSDSGSKGATVLMIAFILIITFLLAVKRGAGTVFFYEMNQFCILATSLTLFYGFLKIDIGHKPIINLIASATFGVYLVHDNGYIRPFLWGSIFKNATYAESNILIPYSIMVILIVFVVCTMIELFRIYILEKYYIKLLNCISDVAKKCTDKLFSLHFWEQI